MMDSFQKHEGCVICGCKRVKALSDYQKDYLVKCKQCNMVFSERVPTVEELNNLYSQYSYSSSVPLSPITILRFKELLLKMEKYRKTGRLLDFGCGRGEFLEVAKSMGWEVYGLEYSEKAIEILRSKQINVIDGNFIEQFEGKDHFDVITAFEVVEHLVFPMESLKIINTWLRKEGCFYMTVPSFNSIGRFRMKERYPILVYPEHVSYFSRKSLKYALRKSGFALTKVLSHGLNPNVLRKRKISNNESSVVVNRSTESIREQFEKSYLRFVKRMLNFALNIFGVGDTLKAIAKK